MKVRRQQAVPLKYEELEFDIAFRTDLVVDDRLIVEIKCVDQIHPVHKAQLLTYLKLTNRCLSLLINFRVLLIKEGITRVVNRLPE